MEGAIVKAFIEKYAPWTVVVLVLVLGSLWIAKSCSQPPKPDVVQQAAQRAASAIVTVEHADSALARHVADSVALIALQQKYQVVVIARTSLQARLAAMVADTPAAPTVVTDTAWHGRALKLSADLDTATAIIAADKVASDAQLMTIAHLTVDNHQLATSLAATRDTLATHREVVVPATPVSSLAGIGSVLRRFEPVVVVGYGVTYAAGSFHTGVQATVGLRVFP